MIQRLRKELRQQWLGVLALLVCALESSHAAMANDWDGIQRTYREAFFIPSDKYFHRAVPAVDSLQRWVGGWIGARAIIFNSWTIALYAIALFIAVQLFGSEFQFGAIGPLLAQPITRRRIFVEKLCVYGIALLPAAVVQIATCYRYWNVVDSRLAAIHQANAAYDKNTLTFIRYDAIHNVMLSAEVHLTLPLLALACGLLMILMLRRAQTAFWAALVFPLMAVLVAIFVLPLLGIHFYLAGMVIIPDWAVAQARHSMNDGLDIKSFGSIILFSSIVGSLAWLKFKRLEV